MQTLPAVPSVPAPLPALQKTWQSIKNDRKPSICSNLDEQLPVTPGEGLGKAGSIRAALQPGLPLPGAKHCSGKSKHFPVDAQCCWKSRYRSWVFPLQFPCAESWWDTQGCSQQCFGPADPASPASKLQCSGNTLPQHKNHLPSSAKLHFRQTLELTPSQSLQPPPPRQPPDSPLWPC